MAPLFGYRTVGIFIAGSLVGFLGAVATLRDNSSPQGLALKSSYLANRSDTRPTGTSQLAREAGQIWDARNADGFDWGQRNSLIDPRTCPGDHGPFIMGCREAAKGRAVAMGGPQVSR